MGVYFTGKVKIVTFNILTHICQFCDVKNENEKIISPLVNTVSEDFKDTYEYHYLNIDLRCF